MKTSFLAVRVVLFLRLLDIFLFLESVDQTAGECML